MKERYERFNELTFEAYCKAAIDKTVLKERMKKAERNRWEQSFSTLTDAALYSISRKTSELETIGMQPRIFSVCGARIAIYDQKLGQALLFLLPKDREIMLLYYFEDMNDDEVAKCLNMSRATVQRRCHIAKNKLRSILESSI